jgi:hypothetical protein
MHRKTRSTGSGNRSLDARHARWTATSSLVPNPMHCWLGLSRSEPLFTGIPLAYTSHITLPDLGFSEDFNCRILSRYGLHPFTFLFSSSLTIQ